MAKKAKTTRELANAFPPQSRVRTDDQSIGFTFLNTIGTQLEKVDQDLEHQLRNNFLTTANLYELDQVYKVLLPKTFTFTTNNSDSFNPVKVAPTVRGLVVNELVSGYVYISTATNNDIDSFWYDSLPNRVSKGDTETGDSTLLEQAANAFPYSGVLTHHLNKGGRIWIETSGGTQYLTVNEQKEVNRGQIIIRGTTRKGSSESETFIFAWDQKQPSLKEWETITNVEVYNIESGVQVSVRSADFNQPPYLSFFNLAYSENRNKIDEFFDIGTTNNSTDTLDRISYVADEWQQLLLGFNDLEIKEQWELLDSNYQPLSNSLDMTIQPFSDKAWVVSSDKKLYCYPLEETMFSGVNFLQERTDGPNVQLDLSNTRLVLGDELSITPLHIRPLKDIHKHRIWMQDPDNLKSGILDGAFVSYSSDFWVYGSPKTRNIGDPFIFTPDKRGEYKLTLETVYEDAETDTDKKLVAVQYKLPLTTLDISSIVSGTIEAIDFDSDQKLWVKTTDSYYEINLHKDVMLVDYENKVIYLTEDYSDVGVTP